jgi:hypothetical protein
MKPHTETKLNLFWAGMLCKQLPARVGVRVGCSGVGWRYRGDGRPAKLGSLRSGLGSRGDVALTGMFFG